MRTLAFAADRQSIDAPISALTVSDQRRWGTMSVDGMVCHLCDAYKLARSEKTFVPISEFPNRTMIKGMALWALVKWPKGTPTPPEVQQGVGGTAPAEFEQDRRQLLVVLKRSSGEGLDLTIPHLFFGRMTRREWLRWGYLHADHPLRQLGR